MKARLKGARGDLGSFRWDSPRHQNMRVQDDPFPAGGAFDIRFLIGMGITHASIKELFLVYGEVNRREFYKNVGIYGGGRGGV